jgi:hypothetical protein
MKVKRTQKKLAFDRVAPKRFVFPAPAALPQQRVAIARAIAAIRARNEPDSLPTASSVLRGEIDDAGRRRAYVRRCAEVCQARIRAVQEQRRRLMALLVGVVSGVDKQALEAQASQADGCAYNSQTMAS